MSKKRIAIAGMMHESNTFSPKPTRLEDFTFQREDEMIAWWRAAHHEVGGFIAGASRYGYDLIPTLNASATPAGAVTADAFESITGEMIDRLQAAQPFDGLLLSLHGAMVSEEYPDGDGEVTRRVREFLGPDFPIIVTHDHHANISQQLIDASTALVIYKTNPHLDQRERGLQAAELMARMLDKQVNPIQALAKPDMLLNIVHQHTNAEPMQSIMNATREIEQQPGILAASVAAGYQYADVYEMGPSAVVVADNDQQLAQSEAQRLSDMLWNLRDRLAFERPDAADAVRQAKASTDTPVVLVEMGDNIGGGSSGDSTFILQELIRREADGWVVVLADPEAVQACFDAGINGTLTMQVGGKQDDRHGPPVEVTGRVKCLHDGLYEETEPRHGGRRYNDQGLTAVLDARTPQNTMSSYLVLTTLREAPMSLHQLLSLGIQPQRQKILVVKAAIAYRVAYEPVAKRIIEVDTPGLTAVNPERFTYRHVRRPMWGLT